MDDPYIYIVQEFIGHGYTREHIAFQRYISSWKKIRAFTEEHEAAKFMESLQKENEPRKYAIEEVPLDVPMSGKLYLPTDNRILC
jgi:hypothetical protein